MKEKFEKEIRNAVDKYGDNQIDIYVEDDKVYGMYHSYNNSFSVTVDYSLKEIGGMEFLKEVESNYEELCICEV